MNGRGTKRAKTTAITGSLARVLGCWTLLLTGALAGVPLLGSFAGCCVIALPGQPPFGGGRFHRARMRWVARAGAVGAAAAAATTVAALLLPQSPGTGWLPPVQGVLAVAVLAPLFEEPLYRGALLRDAQPLVGTTGAVLATSALFSISHIEWPITAGAFAFGIVLGSLRTAGASLATVTGLHAGANTALILFEASGRFTVVSAVGGG